MGGGGGSKFFGALLSPPDPSPDEVPWPDPSPDEVPCCGSAGAAVDCSVEVEISPSKTIKNVLLMAKFTYVLILA